MAKMNEKVKTKYIILTFLSCNRGKKFTARQIYQFIIDNKLNSNNSEIHRNAISRMINDDKRYGSVLSDVCIEKKYGRNYYYLEAI